MDNERDAIERGEETPPAAPPQEMFARFNKKHGHWAEYMVCPVCRTIMSGKAKKLHPLGDGRFTHKKCYEIMKRKLTEIATKKEVGGERKDENARAGTRGLGEAVVPGVHSGAAGDRVSDGSPGIVAVGLHGEQVAGVAGETGHVSDVAARGDLGGDPGDGADRVPAGGSDVRS